MLNKKQYIYVLLIGFCSSYVMGSGVVNWLRPYDTLIKPERFYNCGLQVTLYGEAGLSHARGFDTCGQETNVLRVWNKDQNAITMLMGFDPNSPISQKLAELNVPGDDDKRGHFCVDGTLRTNFAGAVAAHYYFWEGLALALYVPYYRMELDNVVWRSLTVDDGNPATVRVQEELINNFFHNVKQLGQGLNISGWERSGLGDTVLMLEWLKDFPQKYRPMLKNVRLQGRFGLNLPTGVKQDEDKIFAVPFGYDGATGIIAGSGITVNLACYLNFGVDVQLIHLFGTTQERRIKTDVYQTELLLLQKLCTYKDFGLIQRFNLYGELFDVIDGLSLKLGYQFFKQNQSSLAFSSCQFSTIVANTARSLGEYIMHHMIVNLNYDASSYWHCQDRYRPYASVYARLPFKGTNIALVPTMGVVFSVAF